MKDTSNTLDRSIAAGQLEGLRIEEWDVDLFLPSHRREDVKFDMFTYKNGDQTAYFTSKKMAISAPECDLVFRKEAYGEGMTGGIIAITRSKTKPEETTERCFFHVSGYWFTIGFGTGRFVARLATQWQAFHNMLNDSFWRIKSANNGPRG